MTITQCICLLCLYRFSLQTSQQPILAELDNSEFYRDYKLYEEKLVKHVQVFSSSHHQAHLTGITANCCLMCPKMNIAFVSALVLVVPFKKYICRMQCTSLETANYVMANGLIL